MAGVGNYVIVPIDSHDFN